MDSKQNDSLTRSLPIVFSCSGAADVGAICDQAARQMSRDGAAAMSCIAGVSAQVEPIMNAAKAAPRVLALDGCPQDCVAKTLSAAGFTHVTQVRLSDLGMNKKESPLTDERIRKVLAAAKEALEA